MKIVISNTSDSPLYQQIKDQIKDAILKEELVEGDPLPSIRAFANDLSVSVLTIRRVYEELEQEGFVYLPETEAFPVVRGGKYYTKRNGSSIIAFRIPQEPKGGFQILASHSDSPSFKIKGENPFLVRKTCF